MKPTQAILAEILDEVRPLIGQERSQIIFCIGSCIEPEAGDCGIHQ